ncbi:MAG: hypothetical protein WBB67_06170 [bacterium]
MHFKATDAMEKCIKMLSKEVVKKIKEDLSRFFGNSLSRIVLYGSYVMGKETQ